MKRSFAFTLAVLFACLFAVPAFAGGCTECHAVQQSKDAELAPMLLVAPAQAAACAFQYHAEKGTLPGPLGISGQDAPSQRVDYSQALDGLDGPCVAWRISVTHQHQRV